MGAVMRVAIVILSVLVVVLGFVLAVVTINGERMIEEAITQRESNTEHIGGVTEGVRVRDMEREGIKYTLFFGEDGYLVDVIKVN